MYKRLLYCLIILTVFSTSCSLIRSQKATPELRSTVINVAGNYLKRIVLADRKQLNGMILWNDYIAHDEEPITKNKYFFQIDALRAKNIPLQQHPLLNLKILDFDYSGSNAHVLLQKPNKPDSPKISIDVLWTGSGWLVVGDSLFGPNELVEQLLASNKSN